MQTKRIRRLHQNDGTPDCPVCLDDILKLALTMSKDCATLEVENVEKARVRVSKKIKELKSLVTQFEHRMRYEVMPEVRDYRKNNIAPHYPIKGVKKHLKQYQGKDPEEE